MADAKRISACPGWLGLSEDRRSFVYLQDRADTVRQIFEFATGGLGSYAIANLLNRKGVPAFGPSPSWDHTTVDSMLRNRATFGEHQPKSWAGGSKKGVPTGPPIRDYYPAVIDEATFEAAQIARRQNLISGRGRKGDNLANLFNGLTTCAYCRSEVRFNAHGPSKSLVCAKDIDEDACTRTAWSYRDFEINVLQFLAHPALLDKFTPEQAEILSSLVDNIKRLSSDDIYAARYTIALSLKTIVTELRISSGGANPTPRLAGALVRRDIAGRFFSIRLWDGPLYHGLSVY